MSNSLEDERKAILERMSASRRNYRNMFALEDSQEHAHEAHANEAHAFPRSHTFKFITRHPYFAALGALAAVAALPRGSVKKAVKSSAAVTASIAGILGSPTRTSIITHVLPPVIRLLRSSKRRGR
jgi:hypothetical protein